MVFSYAFFVGISRSTTGGCGMQHTGAGTARMASMASHNHFPPPSPRPLHLLVLLLHTVAFYSLSIGLFLLSRLAFFLAFCLFVCLIANKVRTGWRCSEQLRIWGGWQMSRQHQQQQQQQKLQTQQQLNNNSNNKYSINNANNKP